MNGRVDLGTRIGRASLYSRQKRPIVDVLPIDLAATSDGASVASVGLGIAGPPTWIASRVGLPVADIGY